MSDTSPPRRRRSATIKDVARQVGVSAMTVSRVINNKGRFSDATRLAVNEAIEQLGFARNTAARSLALARSVRIGVLYDRPSGAYLSELLIGLIEEANRTGHQIVLQRCDSTGDVAVAISRLLRAGVDGVLIPPPFGDEPDVLARFHAADRPVVTISGRPGHGAVRIDDYAAAQEITRLLIDKGHRRIAFIAGDESQAAARDRQRGYEDACHAAGIGLGPIEAGDFSYRSGIEATERLLTAPFPTALFASNDDMAAAAVTVAHRKGLDVPTELAVVGFDDTRIAITTWPELTTIRQPLADMARAATEILLRAIDQQGQSDEDLILPYTLVERHSA
jgi:LacI family transcriptional regulator